MREKVRVSNEVSQGSKWSKDESKENRETHIRKYLSACVCMHFVCVCA